MSLFFLILLPLAIGTLLNALWRRRGLITALALATLTVEAYLLVITPLGEPLRFGGAEFLLTPLARISLLTLVVVTLVIIAHAWQSRQGHGLAPLALVIMGTMVGSLLSQSSFLGALFLQLGGICSLLLLPGWRGHPANSPAARYLAMLTLGSLGLLVALMLVEGERPLKEDVTLAALIGAGLTLGMGVRMGLVPFHFWLPHLSNVAPRMVLALLVTVLDVAGAFFLATALMRYPWLLSTRIGSFLALLGIVTAVIGALLAMGQESLERLVIYSAIYDMGFILVGLASGKDMGMLGAFFEALNHAPTLLLLFLALSLLSDHAKHERLEQMRGLASRWPVASLGFMVGALAVVGFPLTNTFASRWILYSVAAEMGLPYILSLIGASILVSLAYLRALHALFLGPPSRASGGREGLREVALVLLLILIVAGIGLYPGPILEILKGAIADFALG